MDNLNKYEISVMKQFDFFIKQTIKNASSNYDKSFQKNSNIFVELKDNLISKNSFEDNCLIKKYFIKDEICIVSDETLITLLEQLAPLMKNIILLYYFNNMTDKEISKKLSFSREYITKTRKRALKILKTIYSDFYEK